MSASVGLAAGSAASTAGPYMLRNLIDNVPLSTEDVHEDVQINCVEFLDANLYVGTTAAELLHFVQIPPDTNDVAGSPSYILASRLQCPGGSLVDPSRPGIQQILLLPNVAKATILCNGTVTFYSLPELSPVFGTTQVQNCKWVGGLDLNEPRTLEDAQNATVTILLSLRKMIRVIKIGSSARAMKTIDFGGSTVSIRRDAFACVADNRSYALLDVERQLKIPLFPISSLDDSQSSNVGGQAEDISGGPAKGHQRNASTPNRGHSPMNSEDFTQGKRTSRSDILSEPFSAKPRTADPESLSSATLQRPREISPKPSSSASPVRGLSPNKLAVSPEKPLPVPQDDTQSTSSRPASMALSPSSVYLKPHVISPSPQEFLLVTGTGTNDPGVGIFVNLEGDVTRSTLEFEQYPDALVSDGRGLGIDIDQNNHDEDEEGYVLASTSRKSDTGTHVGLEIQRWDLDPSEALHHKTWLNVSSVPTIEDTARLMFPGVKSVTDCGDMHVEEMMCKLQLSRFVAPGRSHGGIADTAAQMSNLSLSSAVGPRTESGESQKPEKVGDIVSPLGDSKGSRDAEESQFARRLCRAKSRVVVWLDNKIWWAVRTPLVLRLEASLHSIPADASADTRRLARKSFVGVINSIRGHEAKSETEYVSLGYIRQTAGLLLTMSSVLAAPQPILAELQIAEYALLEGALDPRLVMSLFPILQTEVVEGEEGIWVHGGVKLIVKGYLETITAGDQTLYEHSLYFLKTYLAACRGKKGFGSVTSEKEVSQSIDAGLLVVLLELDKESPRGPARPDSIRAELNDLMDHGLDCFDRAIVILESYHRLYALSRLYQSRKMAGEVLATWRRIIEGERDDGGEFTDGESTVRNYLLLIRNEALVQRYGVWLAARNTQLGIQVFSDEKSRVKLEPTRVVEVLRQGAPDAVKHYLEHLVFAKNNTKYVNELIAYYLDNVINKLEASIAAREILARTYESYRALHPPKPTYRQFIIENDINEEWWQSRLRLLQLLGGSHGAASQYDVSAILQRIEPFTEELVPEVIILGGRQSRHQEALRLLTHSLGDYDTAISYCLRGGLSIYRPVSGGSQSLPSHEEQARLFGFLLPEFLRIADISDRVEQTSGLLERFGAWYDVGYVLSVVPDTWAVEIVSGFLVSALRRIVRERSATMVAKALSGSENLRVNANLIRHIESARPSIETQSES